MRGVAPIRSEPDRLEPDSRRYAAEADLDRAIRHIGEAIKFEAAGGYTLGTAARIHATHLLERHIEFLQIDPEAKL